MMKKTYFSLFFVFIFQLFATFSEAKEISLMYSNRSISDDIILPFKDLNENDIVQFIRQVYDIKVIIIDKIVSDFPENPEFTIGNIEEDKEAVRFYTEDPVNVTALKTNEGVAQFIPPYKRAVTDTQILLDDRPYIDKPILLLARNVPRMVIIHEFLHFYLYNADPVRKRTNLINGQHVYRLDANAFYIYHDLRNLRDAKTQRVTESKNLSPEKQDEILFDLYDTFFEYCIEKIRYESEFLGEELDLHVLLLQYREQLGFSENEIEAAVYELAKHAGELKEVVQLIRYNRIIQRFGMFHDQFPEHLQPKYDDLVSLFEEFTKKMNAIALWVEHEGL